MHQSEESAFKAIAQLQNQVKQTTIKKTKAQMEHKFNKLVNEGSTRKGKFQNKARAITKGMAMAILPSETLNQHVLTVNGVEVEYTRNKFFKKIKVLPEGSAFGEVALL